jgi:NAD(P)H-flavin reductase
MTRFRFPRNIIRRPTSGLLIVLGASTGGGFAYRKYISVSELDGHTLNAHNFTPYTLVSKEPVSSSSSIFTLRPKRCSQTSSEIVQEIRRRGVWSVEAKQPQLQIARSYTPLPTTGGKQLEDELRILIRREEGGEVSNYLHNLPLEATIDLRGPHLEFDVPENITDVLFLAGGTGIAPALQIAKILSQRGGAHMHILWANRKREECIGGRNDMTEATASGISPGWRNLFRLPYSGVEHEDTDSTIRKGLIVQELEHLNAMHGAEKIGIAYFVDDEGKFIKPNDIRRHTDDQTSQESSHKLILVSGPDGFVEYWAGKKVWSEGQEAQGPLGGMLAQLKLQGWKVWKL